jgi:hypothetical protein
MGARDIMPFISGSGGHARIISLPVGANTTAAVASTSWQEGEVVEITAASGDIDCTPDGAADPNLGLVYIAAASSAGVLQTKKGNQTTGDADGLLCPVYCIDPDTEFITRNVVSGDDTNIGPAGNGTMGSVTIGATCDLWRDDTNPGGVSGAVNGDFSFDIGGNAMTITQILDSQKRPTSVSGATAHWVVAKLNTIVT